MKSKLFLTVLLLAAITTIGISQEKKYVRSFNISKELIERARIAELERTKKELEIAKNKLAGIENLPSVVRSLVGLKGIYVLIQRLPEDAKSTGLTNEQLKTDVELQLRLAGIKVNSKEEYRATEDMAYICVSIDTRSHNDLQGIVCNVAVELRQKVVLVRYPYTRVRATTWNTVHRGILSKSKFQEEAGKHVKSVMEAFIFDYFTANPKY